MNIEEFRDYCLSKKMVTEDLPFDKDTLVFKVVGKVFALTSLTDFEYVNLKCDPEIAMELREMYSFVKPGYHMNKKHWNSVYMEGVTNKQLLQWVDDSYNLVMLSLPKKLRMEL